MDYASKTADVLNQVADRRKADKEEDDNEDEEHGEGPGMLKQECKTRW